MYLGLAAIGRHPQHDVAHPHLDLVEEVLVLVIIAMHLGFADSGLRVTSPLTAADNVVAQLGFGLTVVPTKVLQRLFLGFQADFELSQLAIHFCLLDSGSVLPQKLSHQQVVDHGREHVEAHLLLLGIAEGIRRRPLFQDVLHLFIQLGGADRFAVGDRGWLGAQKLSRCRPREYDR